MRGNTSQYFLAPPTVLERRQAQILSEQKPRKSITAGFADLLPKSSFQELERALAVLYSKITDLDQDTKSAKDVLVRKEKRVKLCY
jgi:hypothetical protein